MDTNPTNFDPNYDCGIDPRENFPASAEEAEEHHAWALSVGLAELEREIPDDEDCDGPCYDGDTGNRWA